MMRRLLIVAASLLVFLAAVVAFLPASLVLSRFESRLPGLRFEQVSGTVWRGASGRIAVGPQELGRVRWSLSPWSLASGALSLEIDWVGAERRVSGRLWRRGSQLRLAEVDAVLPASVLQGVLEQPSLRALGEVHLAIDHLDIEDGQATRVQGEAWWRDAAVGGAAQARLGDLHARLYLAGPEAVGGELSDRGGPLALTGGFTLTRAGYRTEAQVQGRTPELAEALQWVGEPLPDGARRLIREARWWGRN